jgi:hypothetical protein
MGFWLYLPLRDLSRSNTFMENSSLTDVTAETNVCGADFNDLFVIRFGFCYNA